MTEESLIVSFSNQSSTTDALLLEQEEWKAGVGVITKIDLIETITSTFYNGSKLPGIDCDVEDGAFVTGVFAYPFDPDLVYDIGVTCGTLGEAVIQELEVSEVIKFNLDSVSSSRYPVQEIVESSWYPNLWDDAGNKILEPAFTQKGKFDFDVGREIYGALKLVYKTVRHTRYLKVKAREDVVENFYSSVVWARWDGGVKMLVIDPPAGAEEDYANNVTCATRSTVRFKGNDPNKEPPKVYPENKTINIDYCTQLPIDYV